MTAAPAGIPRANTPQFVVLGFDDNGHSGLPESGVAGGLQFALELLRDRKNPPGRGRAGAFDAAPIHASFYLSTRYVDPNARRGKGERLEDPRLIASQWRAAQLAGHELAQHTHNHDHGREFAVAKWENEFAATTAWLTAPWSQTTGERLPIRGTGLGLRRGDLVGFRTPFLEYGDATFEAMTRQGLQYDCSIEEGFQTGQDGSNYLWPYTLDRGSPGNAATAGGKDGPPLVGAHPGLWELPVYAVVAPPDAECQSYGVEPGLRARLKERVDYFDPRDGKITGIDWNLWIEFRMNRAEFLATLKYTYDLRQRGNRAPLTFGTHSDIYADNYDEEAKGASPAERRRALTEFVDWLLGQPDVRLVSARELLGWLRTPSAL